MRIAIYHGKVTKRIAPVTVLAATLLFMLSPAASTSRAGAGPGDATVMPVQSNPHGQSYARWAADWLAWAAGVPAAQSPFGDTGANLAVDQSKSVWFLAGNFGGS